MLSRGIFWYYHFTLLSYIIVTSQKQWQAREFSCVTSPVQTFATIHFFHNNICLGSKPMSKI